MKKHTIKTIVNEIIISYNKSPYINMEYYLTYLKNNSITIWVWQYEEIPEVVFRYIRKYSIQLIADYAFKKINYHIFNYLQFKSKSDIVRFLKIATGFCLEDCKIICDKYKPFNYSEL